MRQALLPLAARRARWQQEEPWQAGRQRLRRILVAHCRKLVDSLAQPRVQLRWLPRAPMPAQSSAQVPGRMPKRPATMSKQLQAQTALSL